MGCKLSANIERTNTAGAVRARGIVHQSPTPGSWLLLLFVFFLFQVSWCISNISRTCIHLFTKQTWIMVQILFPFCAVILEPLWVMAFPPIWGFCNNSSRKPISVWVVIDTSNISQFVPLDGIDCVTVGDTPKSPSGSEEREILYFPCRDSNLIPHKL